MLNKYKQIRQFSLDISSNLELEDCVVQALEEVSPIKWHLAHTTWFFEEFLLKKLIVNYRPFNTKYHILFNSYYETIGYSICNRSKRGVLSRPTMSEILEYREYVDEAIESHLEILVQNRDTKNILIIGMHHEEQHQELMLMDIKCNFFFNPLFPIYNTETLPLSTTLPVSFYDVPASLDVVIGTDLPIEKKFSYDNEKPLHMRRLESFEISSRPTSNGEYLEFILDGGYEDVSLWLSDGWNWVQKYKQESPVYWICDNNEWFEFTLHGLLPLDKNNYVCHITFYEADAFARWRGCRLPTEFEWEYAYNFFSEKQYHIKGSFSSDKYSELVVLDNAKNGECIISMLGGVWEHTSSHYEPYPRSTPELGAIGEYNHKFMSGQRVLRGGSIFTSSDHVSPSYRNFFQMDKFWYYGGIRLVK